MHAAFALIARVCTKCQILPPRAVKFGDFCSVKSFLTLQAVRCCNRAFVETVLGRVVSYPAQILRLEVFSDLVGFQRHTATISITTQNDKTTLQTGISDSS